MTKYFHATTVDYRQSFAEDKRQVWNSMLLVVEKENTKLHNKKPCELTNFSNLVFCANISQTMARILPVTLATGLLVAILYVYCTKDDLTTSLGNASSDYDRDNEVSSVGSIRKTNLHSTAQETGPQVVDHERRLFFFTARNSLRRSLVTQSLQHDGLQRSFLEFKPENMASSAAMVILLHGRGQEASTMFETTRAGTPRWLELSQQNGFLLLAPSAVDLEWNDLRDPETETTDPDDVGFLKKLIEWAMTERQIDPSRVYVTGGSNGGMMTFRMLLEAPEIVAAGASFVSNLPNEDIITTTIGVSPRPVFIMNGSDDTIVLFNGSQSLRSSDDTRDFFVTYNAATLVTKEALPVQNPRGRCRVISEFYAAATSPVQYYVMQGAGHVYPSTKRLGFLVDIVTQWFLGPACYEVDGVDLAWDFLSRFSL